EPTSDPVVCLDELPPSSLPQALPPQPPRVPSLPQVRCLLRAALPLPVLDVALALALVAYRQRHNLAAYWQRHNLAAYRSHRKRTLQRLAAQGP
ncbi:MAG: hypothetical protein ACR2JY_07165, partial [Chloroflexota bacterium]